MAGWPLIPLLSSSSGPFIPRTQIGAGVHYSAGLGKNGRLYVWGTLGLVADDEKEEEQEEEPAQPKSWDPVKALGMDRSSSPPPRWSLTCGPYHAAVVGFSCSR